MLPDLDRCRRLQPQRSILHLLGLPGLVGVFCLAGCSLQNFYGLTRGSGEGGAPASAGAATGGTGTTGGTAGAAATAGAAGSAGTAATAGTAGVTGAGGTAGATGGGGTAGATGTGGAAGTPTQVGGYGGVAGSGEAGSGGVVSDGGQGGAGGSACGGGYAVCPGEPECVDLSVGVPSGATVDHCGACGTTCSITGAIWATCTEGVCEPSCADGFADCNDAGENDGCEADLEALTLCGTTCEDRVPCESTDVCNAGVCGAPQGMTVFTIPFTEAGQAQRYGNVFPARPSLENANVIMRAYAPGALSGQVRLYLTDADFTSSPQDLRVALSSLAEGWADITIPAGQASGDWDPAAMHQLTIEIEAGAAGPWADPTVIYVDSVRASNGTVNDTFDTDYENMVSSTMLTVEGSKLEWVDALPLGQGGAGGGGGSGGAGGGSP